MKFLSIQAQEDTVAAVDTLTENYSDKWDGAAGLDQASPLIQTAASYDLIFIVLGVSLIIWFVLLFFIIRVDKKVSKLEEEIQQPNGKEAS
ncbi:MAG: CcmD family protein [Bacteroidota bacterium]